jgi:hypothetical protein
MQNAPLTPGLGASSKNGLIIRIRILFAMLLSSVTWQFLARSAPVVQFVRLLLFEDSDTILAELISKGEILTGLTHAFDLLLLQERMSRSLASTKY